jgi:hypothetical protein
MGDGWYVPLAASIVKALDDLLSGHGCTLEASE